MASNYIIWIVAGSVAVSVTSGADDLNYSQQIAPIFAFHCNGCHGDNGLAGGLDARSWQSLRQGGELGSDIVPGDPDASAIVQYVEGRRGEQHRMPLGARPLSSAQIARLRTWIGAGAPDDETAATSVYRLAAEGLAWPDAGALRVSFLSPVEAYLTLRLLTASTTAVLFARGASIKESPEAMNAGAPGGWVRWTLRREKDWPERVDVELEIRYASKRPHGAQLLVQDGAGRSLASREL